MPKFRTDTAELDRRVKRRKVSLLRERLPHEPVWRELRDNFEPHYGRALDGIQTDPQNTTATPDASAILNTHPRLVLARLGSGMQGGITSPASQWFQLSIDDTAAAERGDVKDWLDDTTEIHASAIAASNIYTVLHQLYLHQGYCGNGCALVHPDADGNPTATLNDEGSYWFSADRKGRVNTLLRTYSATASQMAEDFGLDALDDPVRKELDREQKETWFTVNHLVIPNDGSCAPDIDKKRPFLSIYWREGAASGHFLALRSFGYNPILGPRWHVGAGTYGFGPGHIALPDAKELQVLEGDSLEAIRKSNEPPLQVPEAMRLEPINTFPGGLTYVQTDAMGAGDKAGLRPLYETRPDVAAIEGKIRQVEERLNKLFFVDLFAMMLNLSARPKVMTAREVNELAAEKMSLLGPVLTRMNNDLLDPLIDAVFAILLEAGRLPPPPEFLAGKPLTIKYVSILHTEQQSTSRLGSMIRLADFMAMVAPAAPDCVDKLDGDQAIDEAAKVLNVPSRCIRSDAAVATLRAGRAQAQQQALAAQQQAAIPGMASAARDLSETRRTPGSALDALMTSQGITPGQTS